MGSKAFLYLALLLSVLLLISSKVAARDLAQTSTDHDNKKVDAAPNNGVDNQKYEGNYGGYPGYGHGGRDHGDYPSRGGHGGGGRGGDYSRGGRRCYYGCCRRSYYGRECLGCCSYAGEAAQTEKAKPHN